MTLSSIVPTGKVPGRLLNNSITQSELIAFGSLGWIVRPSFSSSCLVVPAQRRFDKRVILGATFVVWAVSAAAVIVTSSVVLSFLPVFTFYFVFGIAYPTFLSIYSLSVPDDEQGWIMGITIAVFTFVGGVMSLIGGWLTSIDVTMPFYLVIGAAILAIVSMALAWRTESIDQLMRRVRETGNGPG